MGELVETSRTMENVAHVDIRWAGNEEIHYVMDLGDSAEEMEINPAGLKIIDAALI